MFKITQTQLLEWVKDGNQETLTDYFSRTLEHNKSQLREFFKMVDDQQRNVVHWAAYLGQLQLLSQWLKEHSLYIDLNQTDVHHYTALDLASIQGYQFLNQAIPKNMMGQFEYKATIQKSNKIKRANPLHWAYYYGNQELIEFFLLNYDTLQFELDQFDMYPIDYLFLENRPEEYQKNYKKIFRNTIIEYAMKKDNFSFNNLRNLNTQRTLAMRSQSLKSNFNNEPQINLKDPAEEFKDSEEGEKQNYKCVYAGLTNVTVMTKMHTSNNSQKRDSLTSKLSQQFKSIQERMIKLQSKENITNQIPLEDSQQELHDEPDAERIPSPKITQPTNTVLADPYQVPNTELISERQQQKPFLQCEDEIPRLLKSQNVQSRSEQSKYQPSQCQQSQQPSQFGRQFSQEIQNSQEFDFRPSMRDVQQVRGSMKPSLKRPGQKLMTRKSTTFAEQYTIFHYAESQSKDQLFECRLQFWSARIGFAEFFVYFLKKKCNPFLLQCQGFNCLHIAAQKGKYNILRCILESDYEYQELRDLLQLHRSITVGQFSKTYIRKDIFNKIEVFNKMTGENPSNALHLAIEQNNFSCMNILVQHGLSVDALNHRCLKPFELTFNERIVRFYENQYLRNKEQSFNYMGYLYVLQTNGEQNLEQDIVMLQLQNIRQSFLERYQEFEFITIDTPNYNYIYNRNEKCSKNHYYVIKLSADTIYYLADKYEIECFHFQKKHLAKFKYKQHSLYESPKDLQVQSLIINILNEEFDLDKFMLEGLVCAHFPLEDVQKNEKISQLWKELQYDCIRDTIRFKTKQVALRPLNAIASYFGPVIAWYLAFNAQIVGWLIIPAVVGSAIQLYQLIVVQINASVMPAYALFMSLWATLFMEKWKNRESELQFVWDMHKFKQQEPIRVMYNGQYVIDQCSNRIQVYDPFTTFKRRIIAEAPIILLGIAIIVISFYSFNSWQQQQDPNNFLMPILINSLNGVSMTIFCDFYKRLCKSVVNWENHKHDLAMQYSYVLKVFLFEFLISYISVVYAVLFKTNQAQLTISVASIIITRGLISNLTSNVIPYLKYKHLKWTLQGQFDTFKEFKKDFKICDMQYVNEKLTYNQQLKFMEIMEDSNNKQPQKELYDEYTSIAIQFGYTTMFSPAFAAAPLFFLLNQYINLQFSIRNYQSVLKRERAQAADSIGIWLSIFEIMNYCSTFMNCIVIGIVNKEEFQKLIGDSNPLVQALVLAGIEHILLFIKYILGQAIPDCPYWVSKELRKQAYLEGLSAKLEKKEDEQRDEDKDY